MLAIRQVTQLKEGNKTPGIDGKIALTNYDLQYRKILKCNVKFGNMKYCARYKFQKQMKHNSFLKFKK